ncbi:hypothetical protein [Variovorax sp. OV329]|uniref:hypothetical protein n=1 Tax=Variovorax sp. OV329 TaxID=1882825 RepID=UPI0008F2FF2E|nr:hypothetical protein [Variovorax sp. OV329]SFM33838.1 DNA polymerase [Variovorax sp. OV329]
MNDAVADDDIDDSAQAREVLQLDARRREMLELMGVRLWWPEPKAAPPSGAAVRASMREAAPSAAPARSAPPRSTAAATDGLLADLPRRLFGGEAATGGWLIVADLPPDMLGGYGDALAGDEGRLLANMLRALRVDGGEVPVHLVRVHRGGSVQSGEGMPRPLDEVLGNGCAPLAPRIVLTLGPLAAQALLRRAGPIGKLRGQAQSLPEDGPMAGAPALASYPLTYLLRNGAEKAKAWADLCQAAALAAGR